jgi:hypothetical protein
VKHRPHRFLVAQALPGALLSFALPTSLVDIPDWQPDYELGSVTPAWGLLRCMLVSPIKPSVLAAFTLAFACGTDVPGASPGDAGDGEVDAPGATAGCTYDTVREVTQADMTALGATLGDIGDRFGLGTPWACSLTWADLGDQGDATWEPHDADTIATLTLAPANGATEYSGGHAPPGTRLACPTYLDIHLGVSLSSADAGFAESWGLDGRIGQFSMTELDVDSDLRALGLYDFAGSYRFEWLTSWPETYAAFIVAVYAGDADQPPSAEGALQEWSQRTYTDEAGVISGGSGDGVIIKTAAWQCPGG